MRRGVKILFAVLGVVALLAVALLVYASTPNKFTAMEEPASAEARERNTLLATALTLAGLPDAFVDVTSERALVAYEVPEDADGAILQDLALGAAARAAPGSARVVIVQMANGTAALTWEVPMPAITKFLAGEIGEEELRAAIVETRA